MTWRVTWEVWQWMWTNCGMKWLMSEPLFYKISSYLMDSAMEEISERNSIFNEDFQDYIPLWFRATTTFEFCTCPGGESTEERIIRFQFYLSGYYFSCGLSFCTQYWWINMSCTQELKMQNCTNNIKMCRLVRNHFSLFQDDNWFRQIMKERNELKTLHFVKLADEVVHPG